MIIPAGYVQVNHFFTGPALPRGAQVTYGLFLDGVVIEPALLAAEVHGFWVARVQPGLSSSCRIQKTRVKFGPNETGPFAEAGTPTNGSDAADATDPQVAVLVRKTTGLGGRKNAGRMFVPGCNEENLTVGGVVDPTVVTAWNTRFANLLADLTGNDTPMVLLHNSALDNPTLVTGMNVEGLVASQRRRVRRVGGRRRVS